MPKKAPQGNAVPWEIGTYLHVRGECQVVNGYLPGRRIQLFGWVSEREQVRTIREVERESMSHGSKRHPCAHCERVVQIIEAADREWLSATG